MGCSVRCWRPASGCWLQRTGRYAGPGWGILLPHCFEVMWPGVRHIVSLLHIEYATSPPWLHALSAICPPSSCFLERRRSLTRFIFMLPSTSESLHSDSVLSQLVFTCTDLDFCLACDSFAFLTRLYCSPGLQLPVSTTHSIVGSVVGMSMVAAGADSVVWSKHKDTFPFLDGMSGIVSPAECPRALPAWHARGASKIPGES
jgi:hypothetical protein